MIPRYGSKSERFDVNLICLWKVIVAFVAHTISGVRRRLTKSVDFLPVLIGTIRLITLKIGFVNLDFMGVCFLQDARQTSCILDIMASIQDNEV